jgi:hypothetical protein
MKILELDMQVPKKLDKRAGAPEWLENALNPKDPEPREELEKSEAPLSQKESRNDAKEVTSEKPKIVGVGAQTLYILEFPSRYLNVTVLLCFIVYLVGAMRH